MRSSMTTVHDWCESSSSCHRRHTHRGFWLTGPDELSRGRLVRLQWECDGDGVQERTKWTLSSVRSTAAYCWMSNSQRRGYTATRWLGACWHQTVVVLFSFLCFLSSTISLVNKDAHYVSFPDQQKHRQCKMQCWSSVRMKTQAMQCQVW